MDVLDPLNTAEVVAPHTTSFSSNIYLLKKEVKTLVKGQLICLGKELTPGENEKLVFVVGKEVDEGKFGVGFSGTTLGRIYGYTLTFVNKKAQLVESEDDVAFGRIYAVDENAELDAEKIAEWNGFDVWAKVGQIGDNCEEEGLWEIMEAQFGKHPELAYYWYIHTGNYKGEVRYTEAGEDEIKALDSLDIPGLISKKEEVSPEECKE